MFETVEVLVERLQDNFTPYVVDTIRAILRDNFNICSKIEPYFVELVVKLSTRHGYQGGILKILFLIAESEGQTSPENQLQIVNTLTKFKKSVIVTYHDFKYDTCGYFVDI